MWGEYNRGGLMDRTKIGILLTIAITFCSFGQAQTGTLKYSLTDLQVWLGSSITSSWANAINASGTVTGDYVDSSGNQICFTYFVVYIHGIGHPQVNTFANSISPHYCDASGINAGGDVGGTLKVSSGGLLNAFLRQKSGTLTTFSSTPY